MQGVLRYNNSTADKDLSAVDWRRRWDSNPRALSDNRISSAARYDHFDTSPRALRVEKSLLPCYYTRKRGGCQALLSPNWDAIRKNRRKFSQHWDILSPGGMSGRTWDTPIQRQSALSPKRICVSPFLSPRIHGTMTAENLRNASVERGRKAWNGWQNRPIWAWRIIQRIGLRNRWTATFAACGRLASMWRALANSPGTAWSPGMANSIFRFSIKW